MVKRSQTHSTSLKQLLKDLTQKSVMDFVNSNSEKQQSNYVTKQIQNIFAAYEQAESQAKIAIHAGSANAFKATENLETPNAPEEHLKNAGIIEISGEDWTTTGPNYSEASSDLKAMDLMKNLQSKGREIKF